jgi:DNA repair exonuclease SbcCD ATPase subunit
MRLTHVAVEGCGRFGRPARIEGLGPGVNILSAGNEAGKSTLFRAVRTCLFERHSSAKEEIASLATEGLSLPVTITVGFETGGKAYEIRKSFLRSKSASLLCGGVETARNAEADEEVWKLLGIEQRSSKAVDDAAYGILWVAQGQSFHTPEPSEAAKSAFNTVIQQEVSTLVGGERARLLLASVNEELGKYLTKTGQPKASGPLDTAQRESTRLTTARIEAETLLEGLRKRYDELEALRAEYRQVSDPVAVQSLKETVAAAQASLAEAETAAKEINRLETEEAQARHWASAQQEKLEQLKKQAADIGTARHQLKLLSAELGPLDAQQNDAGTALRDAAAAKATREEALAEIDTRLSELQRIEATALKQARRMELESRLALLTGLRARARANEAALKAHGVDQAAVDALEAAEREEARILAALEAGAARVVIEAKPGAGLTLNGEAVAGHAARAVTEPVTIAVGSDVSITISPPHAASDAAASALAKAQAALAALLARHAVRTPAELRQRRSERVALENAERDIRAERSMLGMRDWTEIGQLEAAIAEIAAGAGSAAPLPSPEAIAAERQALQEKAATLRAERSSFDAQVSAHRDALTKLAGTRGTLSGQIKAIHGQLETLLAQLPDETRDEVVARAEEELAKRRAAHQSKAAALEGERARAPSPEETERRRTRAERLLSAREAQGRKAEELRQAIARLEGEVEIAGGQGLGEHAAGLKLQQEMAAAEASRLAQRVDVLKHLRDTVESCYARRREELNAPLLRHLRPFLNDVFPEAELALGENFAISGLARSGPAAELFGRLSLGTQEQVAVLVRLAMGAMIAERGEDVPVILDDALVFSDDARIERMFDAISRAGRTQQVIVLTCRARSFTSLGGRQLQIV